MNKTSPSDTISGYDGVDPKVINSGTWQQAIHAIKSDKYKPAIEAIRAIKAAEGEDAYRKAKTKLRAVTFGGTFNGRRHHTTIKVPTGILVADCDHLSDVKKAFSDLVADEHVWFAFISPGGDGIKCGMRSETVTCDAEHKQFFYAVEKYFKDVYGTIIDPACKDISRLSFMSWDPDAYINEAAEYFDHSDFESFDPPPEPPPHTAETTPAKKKYGVKVLESAYLKISNSQPGDQHFTRIKQATNVGGYIPSGYITYDQAITALEQAVAASGAENMVASMKDITDGLAYGATIPLDPIGEDGTGPRAEPGTDDQSSKKTKQDNEKYFDLIEGMDAATLMGIEFPDPEWIIDDILPEGTFIFGGKPKAGKSVFALNMCLAVAIGGKFLGKDIEQGNVLYLHLEDHSRRIQRRLKSMLPVDEYSGNQMAAPSNLHLYSKWPKIGEGGLRALDSFLSEYKIKLVIIDTFKRFHAALTRGDNKKVQYEIDYERLIPITEIAERHNTTVGVIMHNRKTDSDDPIDLISGTLGNTGAVDTICVFYNRRGARAQLHVQGREVDQQDYTLEYAPAIWTWHMLGKTSNVMANDSQQAVIEYLRAQHSENNPATLKDIVQGTEIKRANIQNRVIPTLLDSALIAKKGRNQYYSII